MSESTFFDKIPPEEEQKQKRMSVRFFLITMPIFGILMSIPQLGTDIIGLVEGIFPLLPIATAWNWCTFDERARGGFLSGSWGVAFIFLFPITYPFYLFSRKGLKLGGITLLKSIALLFIGLVEYAFAGSTVSIITGTDPIPFS